jgi:hypothetical protein
MRGRIFFSKGSLPLLFSFLLMILCLAGCAENSNILDNGQSRQLEFSVTTHNWSNSANSNKSSNQKVPSRATPINTFDTSKNFNVIADVNKGGNWSMEINNETVSYSTTDNIWQTTATHYWPGAGSTINFYAYYPTSISSDITHTAGSAPVLSYTVPDNAADQIDILTSLKTGIAGDSYNQTPVDFKHIFAAVQFSVGSNGLGSGTISSISIGNVHDSGTYTFGSGWTLGTTTKIFTILQPKTISGTSGEDIYSGTCTLMMIPQTVSNATVTITYSNGGTLTKTISGTWEAGETYNYGLSFIREYSYTGNIQSFTAPVTGTYKLEVWGAQGGNGGGYGGYSYGEIKIDQGITLYICIGGYEVFKTFKSVFNAYNTYNGGGIGDAAGGGATHISTTNRGELKNYASNQNEVIIVAGGGGGLEWAGKGGDGGGQTGSNGSSTGAVSATGGSQISGGTSTEYPNGTATIANGSFGQGGYGYDSNIDYGAGGGGGWYGGGGTSYAGAGGGGSGHIGSALISGTTGMQNGVRSGDGYARITFVSAN